MRLSTFATSLLVSSAAAWSIPSWGWNRPGVPAPNTPAVSPAPSQVAPSATITQPAPSVPATTPAAGGSTGNNPTSLTADQQKALDAHNDARAEVDTSDLTWDAGLQAAAQEWADNLAATKQFEHSGVSGQGENIYMQYGSGSSTPLTNAVDSFLEEKSLYNGERISSSNFMSFGHYTQIVWKSTTKVGIASAAASDGSVYVVARYTVPGNMIGQAAY